MKNVKMQGRVAKNVPVQDAEVVESNSENNEQQLSIEQGVELIYKALEKANSAGAYSLRESKTVIEVFDALASTLLPKEEE